MPASYRLGGLDLAIISDGEFYADAGTVFGIVPRVMWESYAGTLDAQHRMTLGLNSVVVRSQGKLILIETGFGDKPKHRRNASAVEDGSLISDLDALGITPDEVDVVINTHLHSDHCGWNTRYQGDELVPTFPNAEYLIMRDEWDAAVEPNERTRATYLPENLLPLEKHSRLKLIEGEERVTDEVTIVPTPGHSAGHASVVLQSRGERAVYLGDIAQVAQQFERTAWVSSFDILPLVNMETKRWLFDGAIDDGAMIIGVHAPYPGVGRMSRTEQGHRRWTPIAPT